MITPAMFDQLIVTLNKTDWLVIAVEILTPIIFAIYISRKESKKIAKENVENNKILDERQSRIEKSFDKLVDVQIKVEENLRELQILADESKESNNLLFRTEFINFFKLYDKFQYSFSELKEHYCAHKLEEPRKLSVLYNTFESDSRSLFLNIRDEDIPLIIKNNYSKLGKVVFSDPADSKYVTYFDTKFKEIESEANVINDKLRIGKL